MGRNLEQPVLLIGSPPWTGSIRASFCEHDNSFKKQKLKEKNEILIPKVFESVLNLAAKVRFLTQCE